MSNYYIADLHFGHVKALSFDNRPFSTIQEHDDALISNWNNTVDVHDDVYILGDISFANAAKTNEIIKQLNGNKHLIVGNHDSKLLRNSEFQALFVEICDYKELFIDKKTSIVLSHYPIPCFKNHYYGWVHLYGHVHSSFEWNMMERIKMEMTVRCPCNMYNVGCMMPYMGYTPRTLEHIINMSNHGTQEE